MYNDERRDNKLTRKLILNQFIADPERLHKPYEGLVARDRNAKSRIKRDSARIADLAATTETQLKKLKKLEKESRDLRAQTARDFATLEAYRKESRRLKEDLKRVCGSRSMRIGKFFTSPAQWLRPNTRHGDHQGGGQREIEQKAAAGAKTVAKENGGTRTARPTAPKEFKLWELSFDKRIAEARARVREFEDTAVFAQFSQLVFVSDHE